jgi:acyl phosphate:glycerol-3-phosphate acyltransferase
MAWMMPLFGYLLGSIPTAYVAGRLSRGKDIRQLGDGNMGAQNAFRQLGPAIGLMVGVIDAAKGAFAVLLAQAFGLPQSVVFVTGGAAVIGHNWPFLIGFRGGRGEATTIGILLVLVTGPMLMVALPAIVTLVLKRSVTLATAVLVILLLLVCWWQKVPGALTTYSLALFIIVACAHALSLRRVTVRHA